MSRRLMNLAVSEYWSLHLPTVPDRLESHSGFVRMVKDEAREEGEKLESASKDHLLQKSELEANNQILKEQLENVKLAKKEADEDSAATILKLR